jgi:hypothetical protein
VAISRYAPRRWNTTHGVQEMESMLLSLSRAFPITLLNWMEQIIIDHAFYGTLTLHSDLPDQARYWVTAVAKERYRRCIARFTRQLIIAGDDFTPDFESAAVTLLAYTSSLERLAIWNTTSNAMLAAASSSATATLRDLTVTLGDRSGMLSATYIATFHHLVSLDVLLDSDADETANEIWDTLEMTPAWNLPRLKTLSLHFEGDVDPLPPSVLIPWMQYLARAHFPQLNTFHFSSPSMEKSVAQQCTEFFTIHRNYEVMIIWINVDTLDALIPHFGHLYRLEIDGLPVLEVIPVLLAKVEQLHIFGPKLANVMGGRLDLAGYTSFLEHLIHSITKDCRLRQLRLTIPALRWNAFTWNNSDPEFAPLMGQLIYYAFRLKVYKIDLCDSDGHTLEREPVPVS